MTDSDSPHSQEEIDAIKRDAQFSEIKKEMAAYLAQNLDFDLFQTKNPSELHAKIEELVQEKLQRESVSLDIDDQARLVMDIISSMQTNATAPPSEEVDPSPENLTKSIDSLRSVVAPYIAQNLSNDLLNEGREKALAQRLQELMEEKLVKDDLEVTPEIKQGLLEKICAGMNVPPPPAQPAEEASSEAEISDADTKRNVGEGSDSDSEEEEAMTPELQREILFGIGAMIDSKILSAGDAEASRAHVLSVLRTYCEKENLELDEEIENELISAILGEGTVEFEL